MLKFIKSVIKGIKDAVIETAKSIVYNFEAVIILTLSSIGLTFLLSELPFMISIPLWIELAVTTQMILPVLSVLIITGLVMLMNWRLSCSAQPA